MKHWLNVLAKLTLITLTGLRPEAFNRLEDMVLAQSIWDAEPDISWIVIDDCKPDTEMHCKQRYFRGPQTWKPDLNTQRGNLDRALGKIEIDSDYIFILEDDEFYAPDYLEVMCRALRTSHLVGIANARYYNVDFQGYTEMKNFRHSSLSQTAFRKSALPLLQKAVNSGHFYFDVEFWRMALAQDLLCTFITNTSLSIGIKGLPGRPGLTPSHTDRKGFVFDPQAAKLKAWLPEHWQMYEKYLKK